MLLYTIFNDQKFTNFFLFFLKFIHVSFFVILPKKYSQWSNLIIKKILYTRKHVVYYLILK